MAQQIVTLTPSQSKLVSFEAVPHEAKTYSVKVDGLTGSFRAVSPEAEGTIGITIADPPPNCVTFRVGLKRNPEDVGGWTDTVSIGQVAKPKILAPAWLVTVSIYDSGPNWIGGFVEWPESKYYKPPLYIEQGGLYQYTLATHTLTKIGEPPPPAVYSLGIYYFYQEGCEGSSDIYAWHENWDEHCRWLVGYKATLLANYIKSFGELEAGMPISFVVKKAVPPSFDAFSYDTPNLIKTLPGYDSVDFRIVLTEDNIKSGKRAFAVYETVVLPLWTVEQAVRSMEGDTTLNLVGFEFEHEIAHLFKLDHCYNHPCPMSQCQITCSEWANMGKRLWFCDTHRPILLANWKNRALR